VAREAGPGGGRWGEEGRGGSERGRGRCGRAKPCPSRAAGLRQATVEEGGPASAGEVGEATLWRVAGGSDGPGCGGEVEWTRMARTTEGSVM